MFQQFRLTILIIVIQTCLVGFSTGLKIFTKEELSKYDGSQSDLPIYLAIKGVVYDVSKGAGFYGKDGSYGALAGKDCTRAIAKYSVEEENLTNDITGLSAEELEGLDQMIAKVYKVKYPIVGHMIYFKDNIDEL